MKNTNLRLTLVAAAVSTMLLTGCTSFNERIQSDIAYKDEMSKKMSSDASSATAYRQSVRSDEIWLGPFQWGTNENMKPRELKMKLNYGGTRPTTILATLNKLSRDTGVKISLTEDAMFFLGMVEDELDREGNIEVSKKDRVLAQTNPDGQILNPLETVDMVLGEGSIKSSTRAGAMSKADLPSFLLNGSKSFEEWLEAVSVHYSLFWDYIYIDKKPFITVSALTEENVQFEGLSNTSASGEGQQEDTSSWEELEEYIAATQSQYGKTHFSKLTGRVYIRDRPEIVDRIKKRISYENSVLGKMVHYSVQLVTVDLTESNDIAGGVGVLYNDLRTALTFDPGVTGSTGAAFGIADVNPTSTLNGTSGNAYLSAVLSGSSDAKEYSFITRNRTATEQSFKDIRNYVKTVETSASEFESGVTPTIDTIDEGVTLNIGTSILANNRISIDLGFGQEYLRSLLEREYDGNEITLPTVNDTKILNKMIIKSGQSIVLTDGSVFSDSESTAPTNGMGLWKWVFGASESASERSSVRLLVITPTIIDGGA